MTWKIGLIVLILFAILAFNLCVYSQAQALDNKHTEENRSALARLSFWISPERSDEFESKYRSQIVPILKAHGLVESPDKGRYTSEHIFSRLFTIKTPSEVSEKRKLLSEDPVWKELLKSLGLTFETIPPNSPIRYEFSLYNAPAGSGRRVLAGSGKSVFIGAGTTIPAGRGRGNWRTYDITDGLAGSMVTSIFQDKDDYLWFCTNGGVSRYDGYRFKNFSKEDGLAHTSILSGLQDKDGIYWFGTDGYGVSRYDGHTWMTINRENGLIGDEVYTIFQDRDGYIWFGTDGGLSKYDGKNWVSLSKKDGLAGHKVYSIFQDKDDYLWFGTNDGGACRYDGKKFTRTLNTKDGLAHNDIRSIFQDKEGHLWFATYGNGISRYDGVTFSNLLPGIMLLSALQTHDGHIWVSSWYGVACYDGQSWSSFSTQDGLANNWVRSIYQDREGFLWFGAYLTGGVSRYDEQFITFTEDDGLVNNEIMTILQDKEGKLWFGTAGRGVTSYDGVNFATFPRESMMPGLILAISQDREGNLWFGSTRGLNRYDGSTFTFFTSSDGLPATFISDDGVPQSSVYAIAQDKSGNLWLGIDGGLTRYNGKTFVTFTTKDGLPSNKINSILLDMEGHLWIATSDGLCQYNGLDFTTSTEADGLANNFVNSILQDRAGDLWFGTNSGVSQYNRHSFISFTKKDGLACDTIASIIQDRKGILWFGTDGGVSQYDGRTFQTITRQDGLASNTVRKILQSQTGEIWFGTLAGITRFRPPASLNPPIFIDAVVADQRYAGVSEVILSPSVKIIAFEFQSRSFKTLPKSIVYRYRLRNYNESWKTTKEQRVEYQAIPKGEYIFEVQAVDRDLNYSRTANVELHIIPPFYMKVEFLILVTGFGATIVATMMFLAIALVKRRRQVHAYQQEAVLELQDARKIQMSLLPEKSPSLDGFDIAGLSIPAKEVGGDFFDYLTLGDGIITIALADVSGKGMKGAMNAVLTNGMLHEISTIEANCGRILSKLNADLHSRIERLTFVCLELATIYRNEKIRFANAAQPRPIIKRGGDILEFESDSELPLSMKDNTVYADYEMELQSGDIVIFYTDGIIEAENSAREMYEDQRLRDFTASIDSSLDAREIIEALLQDISRFVGNTEQYDDMTVVVMKKF